MSNVNYRGRPVGPRKKTSAAKKAGIFGLVATGLVLWIIGIAASLAVPALAVWALLHFAFGIV